MKSELAVLDLSEGAVTTLLVCDDHVEAPNWAPDGRTLIVNGGGRLYRVASERSASDPVALDSPEFELIDTGFAVNCNNDHGISPDGSTLVISDSTEEGASAIYTLPIGGGEPRRVTGKTPSYWHGWSPDGGTLAYTAERGAGYQIHTCPVEGGKERCLTAGFDHCDGPDYSADGRWVWFNGEKDGAVDLWRVGVDAGEPQRMTDGASVDWFPHPSPDGRQVLYLAYAPGTRGHPAEKDVALRLLPAEGGDSRELVTLFGGQGTLNVPCWAPDGQRFAFVRYLP